MIIQLQNDTTTLTLYNHINYKTTQLQISIKNMTLPSEKSMPSSHHPCYDTKCQLSHISVLMPMNPQINKYGLT